MGPLARAGIAAAALVVAVALFVVLAGGDEGGDGPATTPAPSTPTTQRNGTERSTAVERPKARRKPTIPRIVVRGGKPIGGVRQLEYESGERVRFSVRSDVAEEVHVHGFDVKKDVSAGGKVRFGFAADIEGVFEVELEHSHVQIAELRVEP
jgi:hypothetical protein